jgi:DNA ligase-1
MSKSLQPMLADNKVKIDQSILPQLQYPLFGSPKLDGIRLRIDPQLGAVSRTHKPIPNQHIQDLVKHIGDRAHYLDGEFIMGDPTAPDVYIKSQSALMSEAGEPPLHYYVFDNWQNPDERYESRMFAAATQICSVERWTQEQKMIDYVRFFVVPQVLLHNPEEVTHFEERTVEQGYEGLILRSTTGRYKNGRSTFKEGLLLKFKRMQDAEATVVGFQQLERNQNDPVKDVFGFTRRSSHKAGRVPDNLLGALVVQTSQWGEFTIGSGFDEATRIEIWHNQDRYLGKTVSFKYQPHGMKDKPRFPIFKGFRHD